MVVTVVAVAREGPLEARVLILWVAELITGVGRDHECIVEVIIEVRRELSSTMPSINRHHRLFKLFLRGRHIVIDLEQEVGTLVVHGVRPDQVIGCFYKRVLPRNAIVLPIIAFIKLCIVFTCAERGFIVILISSDQEVFAPIERIGLLVAFALLLS